MKIGDFLVALFPFCICQTAVIDHELVAKDLLQTAGELGGERYLRHQIQDVLTGLQLLLNEVYVDVCLTAGGDPVQEDDVFSRGP